MSKVVCHDVDEFLECLGAVTTLFESAVRVSVYLFNFDGNKRKYTTCEVNLQASAVAMIDDGNQYLIEFGEVCGKNYKDQSQEFIGTENANELKAKIKAYVEGRGWRLLPGTIEI